MPNTTKAFVSIGSVDQFQQAWDKTQIGKLLGEPVMQPFVESLKKQLSEKWAQTHRKLGLTWDDLQGVASGEVGMGLIMPAENQSAMAVVADVTGKDKETAALIEKINKNMAANKAVRTQRNVAGVQVTVLDVPKQGDYPASQVAYAVKENVLSAADNLKVLEGILNRQGQAKGDSLGDLPQFGAIVLRCKAAAGDLAPQARWYIDPFGYADLSRVGRPKVRGTDMLKVLKDEGFTDVKSVGGYVNFSEGKYEMLHRTWIHAPGYTQGSERFRLAARMLDFPNGGEFGPPAWVPRDVASYIALNVNVPVAFESSKTLVDRIAGDAIFEDVLDAILTDKKGPKLDVRRELIANLGNRITIISDLQLPITPKSERVCFCVETKNEAAVLAAITKFGDSDPDRRRREINGHTVWESIDRESEMPLVMIENTPALGFAPPPPVGKRQEDDEEEEKQMLPNSAVTVANGQLFFSTHIDILFKVLADESERGKLADAEDYKRVAKDIIDLRQPTQSVEVFTRTDDAYQGVYELMRTGKMPEAESLLGRLLNALMSDGKEGALRSQRIDASTLPDYDYVRRSLGPAGMTLTTEDTGWFMTGFTLNKEEQ